MTSFQKSFTHEQRLAEANRILAKHPTRVPIVFEKMTGSDAPTLKNQKYLVPKTITVGQFIHTMRKKIYPPTFTEDGEKLDSSQALFLFVNGTLPKISALMSDIYNEFKHEDNFTYVTYSTESTFG